jgi:hypothetical protein
VTIGAFWADFGLRRNTRANELLRCPPSNVCVAIGSLTWMNQQFLVATAGKNAVRAPRGERRRLQAWRFISLKDQWDRFVADVPPGEPQVLSKRHFDQWSEAYLDIDPESRTRTPAAVKGAERSVSEHLRCVGR